MNKELNLGLPHSTHYGRMRLTRLASHAYGASHLPNREEKSIVLQSKWHINPQPAGSAP